MSSQEPPRQVTTDDRVVDRDAHPREQNAAVVLETPDEPAGEHYIPALDATVAAVNPEYPEDDAVAVVVYEGDVRRALDGWQSTPASRRGLQHVLASRGADVRRYSFPASRLQVVGNDWSPTPSATPEVIDL